MTIEERIRSYGLVAVRNTLNGPDPDSDIDKMYIPDQYNRAMYQTIIHDLMQHLAAHALSYSTAMDVYAQWTEMYEGKVPDRGPKPPLRDPNDYDF